MNELKYEKIRYSICGAITNASPEELQLFNLAEEKLKLRGYEVFNPLRYSEENPGGSWSDYMEVCILELLKNKHVLVLPTIWNGTVGGALELRIATDMNFTMEMYNAF